MIDNYDSFTYNLVQYFGELGQEVKTFRNDRITIEEIKKKQRNLQRRRKVLLQRNKEKVQVGHQKRVHLQG